MKLRSLAEQGFLGLHVNTLTSLQLPHLFTQDLRSAGLATNSSPYTCLIWRDSLAPFSSAAPKETAPSSSDEIPCRKPVFDSKSRRSLQALIRFFLENALRLEFYPVAAAQAVSIRGHILAIHAYADREIHLQYVLFLPRAYQLLEES